MTEAPRWLSCSKFHENKWPDRWTKNIHVYLFCGAQLMEDCSMNFYFRSSRKSVEVGAVVNKSLQRKNSVLGHIFFSPQIHKNKKLGLRHSTFCATVCFILLLGPFHCLVKGLESIFPFPCNQQRIYSQVFSNLNCHSCQKIRIMWYYSMKLNLPKWCGLLHQKASGNAWKQDVFWN